MSTNPDFENEKPSYLARISAFVRRKTEKFQKKRVSRTFKYAARAELLNTDSLSEIHFIVYYGDSKAASHFDLWDPVFEVSTDKYASIFRSSAPWAQSSSTSKIFPVSSINQISPLLERMPNLKAVFYPANNGVNLQIVRNNELQHIFLGHGDSDKASSAHKVFRLYDEVWTGGQNHIDRFDPIDASFESIDFRIIGQPWMKSWVENFSKPNEGTHIDWGYFPTWGGYFKNTGYSSLFQIKKIASVVHDVLGGTGTGRFKLHPWTPPEDVDALEDMARSFEMDVVLEPKENPLKDVLSKPLRFVVCDISGAVTECLYIDVPIFLYRPLDKVAISDDFEQKNAFCYIFSTPEELEALLNKVILEGDDFRASIRKEFLDYRVDITKTKLNQFAKELERL